MTEHDEAKPKRRRNRRKAYPKRVELRLDDELDAKIEELRESIKALRGRSVSKSAVIREATRDGCKALARELRRAPAVQETMEPSRIDELIDEIGGLRTDLARDKNNLNQIARVGNSTGQPVKDVSETLSAIERVDERLVTLLDEVIGSRRAYDDGEGEDDES